MASYNFNCKGFSSFSDIQNHGTSYSWWHRLNEINWDLKLIGQEKGEQKAAL